MNELLFLSLNQFIKCKKGERWDERSINTISNNIVFPSSYRIEKLKDKLPLSYNDCHFLIHYLNLQQSFLERKGYGFFLLDIEHIIIIERGSELIFAYLKSEHIKKINANSEITIMSPFSIGNSFCSPEILGIKSIPSSVSYKCFYYSLGSLTINCLFFNENRENDHSDQTEFFESIKNTKLYMLIKRIMHDDPKKRILLLI
jgi:hypothetical protein